jgi:hypothetical protein
MVLCHTLLDQAVAHLQPVELCGHCVEHGWGHSSGAGGTYRAEKLEGEHPEALELVIRRPRRIQLLWIMSQSIGAVTAGLLNTLHGWALLHMAAVVLLWVALWSSLLEYLMACMVHDTMDMHVAAGHTPVRPSTPRTCMPRDPHHGHTCCCVIHACGFFDAPQHGMHKSAVVPGECGSHCATKVRCLAHGACAAAAANTGTRNALPHLQLPFVPAGGC